jgi:hypothetical protein
MTESEFSLSKGPGDSQALHSVPHPHWRQAFIAAIVIKILLYCCSRCSTQDRLCGLSLNISISGFVLFIRKKIIGAADH